MTNPRLCVVVPYRNRESHLVQFVPHICNYLTGCSVVEFSVIIVEQEELTAKPFNRGQLCNTGFCLAGNSADYFCFHDIDMLPENADYSYSAGPVHLATECSQFGYQLPYPGFFGGVCLFSRESFVRVNGYSNLYWGWGGEDDDLLVRCIHHNYVSGTDAIPRRLGRFRCLDHHREVNQKLYKANLQALTNASNSQSLKSGLSDLCFDIWSQEILGDNVKIVTVSI